MNKPFNFFIYRNHYQGPVLCILSFDKISSILLFIKPYIITSDIYSEIQGQLLKFI